MRLLALLALPALLVVAACGEGAIDEPSGDGDERGEPAAAGETFTGALGGDPHLEGGCVWLETPEQRLEVAWPDGWEADPDPVALRDPDGTLVAEAGDEITVTGEIDDSAMTICQIGPLLRATDVTGP